MSDWTLRKPWTKNNVDRDEPMLTREWLVGNGMGGYASGTLAGVASRRYHSLLNAALPAPLGRQNMLNHLTELLRFPDGSTLRFGGEKNAGTTTLDLHGAEYLKSFRLEFGLPVANGILTTEDEPQALARLDKGAEAVQVAVEMGKLRARLKSEGA